MTPMDFAFKVLMDSSKRRSYNRLYQLAHEAVICESGELPKASVPDAIVVRESAGSELAEAPETLDRTNVPVKKSRVRHAFRTKLMILRHWRGYTNPADTQKCTEQVGQEALIMAYPKQVSAGTLSKWKASCLEQSW